MAKKTSGSVLGALLGPKEPITGPASPEAAVSVDKVANFDDQLQTTIESFKGGISKIAKTFGMNPADSPVFGELAAWIRMLLATQNHENFNGESMIARYEAAKNRYTARLEKQAKKQTSSGLSQSVLDLLK
jgi:hypothetical protein